MKREEKHYKSSQEILAAAMTEFGTQDYGAVTLNSICEKHHLSKGLFYHYFSGRDELFLACVRKTFAGLAFYMEEHFDGTGEFEENIGKYFCARNAYFARNPYEKRIFFTAAFQCPAHLQEQVTALRQPLHDQNRRYIRRIFERLELRPGVSMEAAERYFGRFDEIFGSLFGSVLRSEEDLPEMEAITRKLLDFMLYGVARQKEGQ